MLAWDHWHIEPSSICTLRCPRCPRSEVPETLLNRQLTLDFFQQQIGADIVRKIKKITFCGNDGDPIYCRDILDICQWLKQSNSQIHLTIITNGSHKPTGWWQQLAQILDHRDEINWSLDGWDQASNQNYRINSDWTTIIDGYRAFAAANSATYRVWAAIAFRFNADHLVHMRDFAQGLEFDLWQLTKSTKFGSHYPDQYGSQDPLQPEDAGLIAQGHRFQRDTTDLSGRPRPADPLKETYWQRSREIAPHSAICMIGNKGVFLDSQGRFYPCCWTANRYVHNQDWHDRARHRFDLNDRTFQQVLDDPFWQDEFLRFDSHECRTKCTPERLEDREHVTEW